MKENCIYLHLGDTPSDEVIAEYKTRSGKFDYHKFVNGVRTGLRVGQVFNPRGMYRYSKNYGNTDTQDVACRKFITVANVSQVGWKRVILDTGGYGYMKTAATGA